MSVLGWIKKPTKLMKGFMFINLRYDYEPEAAAEQFFEYMCVGRS